VYDLFVVAGVVVSCCYRHASQLMWISCR